MKNLKKRLLISTISDELDHWLNESASRIGCDRATFARMALTELMNAGVEPQAPFKMVETPWYESPPPRQWMEDLKPPYSVTAQMPEPPLAGPNGGPPAVSLGKRQLGGILVNPGHVA